MGLVKECVMYRWGVVWYIMVVFVQRRDRRNYKWQKVKTIIGVKGGEYLKGDRHRLNRGKVITVIS